MGGQPARDSKKQGSCRLLRATPRAIQWNERAFLSQVKVKLAGSPDLRKAVEDVVSLKPLLNLACAQQRDLQPSAVAEKRLLLQQESRQPLPPSRRSLQSQQVNQRYYMPPV